MEKKIKDLSILTKKMNIKNAYKKWMESDFIIVLLMWKKGRKKIQKKKKIPNIWLKIKDLNDIKSYYPKKKEIENLESIETNSSSEEETKKINKRRFSDNLLILESNDHPLINENIQKSINKMFNYYKNTSEMSGMILYYSSNINNFNSFKNNQWIMD